MSKYIASVSFGKDSLAMVLLLIEKNEPLDEVVFYDTGMEFECIYKMRDKLLPLLNQHHIKYTELKPRYNFKETMLNKYGWCGGPCRWGTGEKIRALHKYDKDAHWYVGIALDEPERLKRLNGTNKSSPLEKYHMTEADCLQYCKDHGYDWDGLYNILKRVSCWCCRNKNLKELANYKKYLPEYFNKLIELEDQIGEPMKKPYYLNERFKDE